MNMFVYLKYLANNLFKNIFFYFSTACTIFVTTFLLFGLPVILESHLNVIMNYIYFFILIILFQVFHAANLVTIVFRQSIDDGTELILQSKPITRTKLVYTKILFFLVSVLTITAINAIITSFTIIYSYGGVEIGTTLVKNMVSGTIIVYSLFGSLAILLCMAFKQLTTIMFVVGAFLIMMIYSLISNQIFMSVSKYLRKKENIELAAISLVNKDKNNKLSYAGGTSAAFNGTTNYITKEIYSRLDIDKTTNPTEFLQYKWNKTIKNNHFIPYLYTNFVYQLATVYTQVPQSYLDRPFASLSYWIRSSNSFNLNLKFTNPTDFGIMSAEINNVNYSLANNSSMFFTDKNGNPISNRIQNTSNKGQIDSFDETTPLPLNLIDSTVNFLNLDYSQESLKLFVDNYLSTKQLTLISIMNKFFEQLEDKISPLSYYVSLFNYLNLNNFINQKEMSLVNYKEKHNLQKIFDSTTIQTSKFQYLAFEALKNKDTLNLSNAQVDILANALGVSTNQTVSNVVLSIIQLDKISPEYLKNADFYLTTPFFKLIDSDYLTTFNFVDVETFYNYNSLLTSWMVVSFSFLGIATICYFRHDFY